VMQYFEEKFPDKRPLLPVDLVKRATVRQVRIQSYKARQRHHVVYVPNVSDNLILVILNACSY